MVLAELGDSIRKALSKLNKATIIDEAILKEILGDIAVALLKADVNAHLVQKLRENITTQFKLQSEEGANLRKLIQSAVVTELTSMLQVERQPFQPKKGKPNVIMFVGLQGSGKTTTCTKYALYWQVKGWKTGMVCADTFRAGAFDQLKQNSTKVRVPFYGSYTETDPVQIAQEGVNKFKEEGYEIIIVDTSGRHKQEQALFDEMKQVEQTISPDDIIFVMDSSIGQACYDQALAFRKAVNVGSVIITKLDGHAKGGGALSAVSATQSPIIFIGTGEHFDDLDPFNPKSFIQRLLGMGDIEGLLKTVQNAVKIEDQNQMMKDLMNGQFSMRSLQSQFQSILKIGSINNFMSMVPGLGSQIIDKNNEKESIKRIQRFMHILDSMRNKELDGEAQLTPAKIYRIARGAGVQVEEVYQLIEEYKRLKKAVTSISQANIGGKGGEMQQIMRNPNQIAGKINSMMDPRMINQLGGMDNIMDMMKNFSKQEGFGDLMKQYGGKMGKMLRK